VQVSLVGCSGSNCSCPTSRIVAKHWCAFSLVGSACAQRRGAIQKFGLHIQTIAKEPTLNSLKFDDVELNWKKRRKTGNNPMERAPPLSLGKPLFGNSPWCVNCLRPPFFVEPNGARNTPTFHRQLSYRSTGNRTEATSSPATRVQGKRGYCRAPSPGLKTHRRQWRGEPIGH
jgi:hypothetical protein